MKTSKSNPKSILLGKKVIIRKSSYTLKFRIDGFDGRMFEGLILEASENSPFVVGSTYSVSENEIKYHSVIS